MNECNENHNETGCPVVSIVMIAYNNERYISDAIKGVVKQRVDFPIELIISDDASTDKTSDIIEYWRKRYPHIIRAYRNPTNLGLQANYLKAFQYCRGEYLAMCDADDYWICRSKLYRQVNYMRKHPQCAITFHRVINYFEDTGVKSLSNGNQKTDTSITDLSCANYITNMSVLYRLTGTNILRNLPKFMSEIKLLDYAMHMLVADTGYIHYFSRPMGVYRQYAKGTWSQAKKYDRLSMSLAVREHLITHFQSNQTVCTNLKTASAKIIAAMFESAGDDAKLKLQASERQNALGVKLQENQVIQKSHILHRLLRKMRIIISKMIPIPRP